MTVQIDAQILRLAQRGFRLVPVLKRGKQPLISDWPHQATCQVEALSGWHRQFTGCNWGVATGKESGFFVIDVDGEDGKAAIFSFCNGNGHGWTETLAVRTARGCHFYFKYPEHATIRNSAGRLAKGLDLRGEGGYVLVPPSEHETGCLYEFIGRGEDVEILEAPNWLIEKLAEPKPNPNSKAATATTIPQGRRNDTLASLAGTLHFRGFTPAAIEAALFTQNEQRCQPPLKEHEVRAIVASVSRYPVRPPTARVAADWPEPLRQEAFHGLAGEIVRTIEPHSEADPAGLLLQFLVAVGNVLGSGPHFKVESDRHGLNLFVVVVGTTAKGRKGTSWGHVRRLSAACDPGWSQACVQAGLSSGEGLIHAVRDPAGDDAGVQDKRLLIVESEFASTLRVLARDGNTLSPTLRLAWDGGILATLTKQSPEKATGAYVSVIAHVTRDELRCELTRTDAGNGFGNRFLYACVQRSKALPDGGQVPPGEIADLEIRLRKVLEHGRALQDYELKRDQGAGALWHDVYEALSEGSPGLLGAVTSRAEAQVMRIACIYAMLDCAPEIRAEHLSAALAVWDYCEASAKFIFGTALGNPVADELLRCLRRAPNGMTRTELSGSLGRNQRSEAIGSALSLLAEHGLVRAAKDQTDGRPAERWFAVECFTRAAAAG